MTEADLTTVVCGLKVSQKCGVPPGKLLIAPIAPLNRKF